MKKEKTLIVVFKHPAGEVYLRKGSSKLWARVGRERFPLRLENDADGRELARQVMDDRWLKKMGVVPVELLKQQERQIVYVQQAFRQFLATHGMRRAKQTREWYRFSFQAIVGRKDYPLTREAIEQDIRAFTMRKDVQQSTIEIRLRAFYVFLNWCRREDPPLLTSIPRTEDVMPKVPEKRIELYTATELEKLFEYFKTRRPEFGLFLQFLYESGFRVHEVLELRWDDVLPDQISVLSKDGKHRQYVPRTTFLNGILAQIPQEREKVFRWSIGSLSRLRGWLDEAMKELHIPKRGRSFHVFRKTRWTYLVKSGVRAENATRIMRCSYQTALKHYIVIEQEELKRDAERASMSKVIDCTTNVTTVQQLHTPVEEK
ncbi:MAG TPA: tyrosine-type recombinase/integrase [Candidatus Kapabacteria bacterium]|nr:tyrosine-type recombinase/integrase [Candidatus Kapabacteria bacterium]